MEKDQNDPPPKPDPKNEMGEPDDRTWEWYQWVKANPDQSTISERNEADRHGFR